MDRSATFALEHSALQGSTGFALSVASAASLRLDDVWIHDVRHPSTAVESNALLLEAGSVVCAERLAMTNIRGRSVRLEGSSGSQPSLTVAHAAFTDSWGECIESVVGRIALDDVAFARIEGDMIQARFHDHLELDGVSFENDHAIEESAIHGFAPSISARRVSVRNVQTAVDVVNEGVIELDELVAEAAGAASACRASETPAARASRTLASEDCRASARCCPLAAG